MKVNVLVLGVLVIALISGCNSTNNSSPNDSGCNSTNNSSPYDFNGEISETVLRNYLSKAVTHAELCTHPDYMQDGENPCIDDDVRMLDNIGAKFIGRAFFRWGGESSFNHPGFMRYAQNMIRRVHEKDPDVIFQAAIFEAVSNEVETVSIPPYVFKKFGMPVENRNFDYVSMLSTDGRFVNHWGKGISVPDISKMEAKFWLYFLATKYINAGFEAIHWGQVSLMAMNDPDLYHWQKLLDMVRDYANENARRSYVLSDAHAPEGGFKIGNKLLFDFHSFPLRIKEDTSKEMAGILEVNYHDAIYNKSFGGIAPCGWKTESLPYLVEFDNYGISSDPGNTVSGSDFVWGYDEITWFSLKSDDEKKEWLEYAFNWLNETDSNGYLQMPTCRMVVDGVHEPHKFKANKKELCVVGTGLETKIKQLWENE